MSAPLLASSTAPASNFDSEIDPWLLPTWMRTALATCDGCARPDTDVMRVPGGGDVALCRKCHDTFMDAWRREDIARERSEALSAYLGRGP